MLSWFRRKPAQTSAPEEQFEVDENGRSIAPRFPGLSIPGEATLDQRRTALRWSMAWNRHDGGLTDAEALETLAKAMIGTIRWKDIPSHRVVAMAARALRSGANYNRAQRCAALLPWVQFRLGPQEKPCRVAVVLDGQFIAQSEHPQIPLPGCEADQCRCWLKSVTKAERDKKDADSKAVRSP